MEMKFMPQIPGRNSLVAATTEHPHGNAGLAYRPGRAKSPGGGLGVAGRSPGLQAQQERLD
jgi:hypothetical protein